MRLEQTQWDLWECANTATFYADTYIHLTQALIPLCRSQVRGKVSSKEADDVKLDKEPDSRLCPRGVLSSPAPLPHSLLGRNHEVWDYSCAPGSAAQVSPSNGSGRTMEDLKLKLPWAKKGSGLRVNSQALLVQRLSVSFLMKLQSRSDVAVLATFFSPGWVERTSRR